MPVVTLTIDDQLVSAPDDQTILDAVRSAGIPLPTLCHLDGVSDIAACRVCLVDIEGYRRLTPACMTKVAEGMVLRTDTERLRKYRKLIVELILAERNHVCAFCVANDHCELQDLAIEVGVDHVRFDYVSPKTEIDVSHHRFGMDHSRCVLCTRCVRTCHEIEGAHAKDVEGRGLTSWIVTGLKDPWALVDTCTDCGKCVTACPTGALFTQGATAAEMQKDRSKLAFLRTAREKGEWLR